MSNATLTAAAARAADDFEGGVLVKKNQAGIIVGLYFITLFSNLCGVQVSDAPCEPQYGIDRS